MTKIFIKKNTAWNRGWGDGTVWKVLASQAREPELDAHHWRKNLGLGLDLGLGLVWDVAP